MKEKPFTGRLLEPIQSGDPERVRAELREKLALLFEHYGPFDFRKPDEPFRLVFKMACDLVPGFEIVGKRKRRPRIDPATDIMLLADVMRLIDEKPGRKVSEAVNILVTSRKDPRRWKRWSGKKKETLENRFWLAVKDAEVGALVDHMAAKKKPRKRSTKIPA